MYENLFNLIDDLQKVAIKIKIQEVLNTLCKDERVHEILEADVVDGYNRNVYHLNKALLKLKEKLNEEKDQ